MSKLLSIMALLLLASCGGGGGGGGVSPHTGKPAQQGFCETGYIYDSPTDTCSVDLVNPLPDQVDSELSGLVDEYKTRSGRSSLPSNMKYIILTDEFDSSIAGGCFKFNSGNREIRINRSFWQSESSNKRKVIMFHELGHCMENLDHTHNAANLNCIPQLYDNTVNVMDACVEPIDGKYIVSYWDDWATKTSSNSAGSYAANEIPPGVTAFKHQSTFGDEYYHILLNAYSYTDLFTRYFDNL